MAWINSNYETQSHNATEQYYGLSLGVNPRGFREFLRPSLTPLGRNGPRLPRPAPVGHCSIGQDEHSYRTSKRHASRTYCFCPKPEAELMKGPGAVDRLRTASMPEMIDSLGSLPVRRLGNAFCRVVTSREDASAITGAYIRHRNGDEGFWTQRIRLLSLPLTRGVLRLGVSANQVTLAGLALVVGAALLFSRRTYDAGLAGALLYFIATVLDCSDGEVARANLTDSPFGAWLETIADYLSYFLVIAGLGWGELRFHGVCPHIDAAVAATAASLVIVGLVGWLRGRTAGVNPGAFDDAVVAEFRRGTLFQRFVVWGRQLIKRSFFAHLVVFHAVIGHLPALLYVWAYGSVGALAVVLLVTPSLHPAGQGRSGTNRRHLVDHGAVTWTRVAPSSWRRETAAEWARSPRIGRSRWSMSWGRRSSIGSSPLCGSSASAT